RVAHFHLCAAPLTADLKVALGHVGILSYCRISGLSVDRSQERTLPAIVQFCHPVIAYMVPAVILAAGKSTRMGRLKATMPVDVNAEHGDTFLTHIVRTFEQANVDDVVVVIGHDAELVVQSTA